jgi:hypothetical protein
MLRDGYHGVFIAGKNRRVHRLVAQLYLPNPDNLPLVHHRDGDRHNPHVDNLEWVTDSQNKKEAWAFGSFDNRKTGIINHADLYCIFRYKWSGASVMQIAKATGIGHATISRILSGRRWKYAYRSIASYV